MIALLSYLSLFLCYNATSREDLDIELKFIDPFIVSK